MGVKKRPAVFDLKPLLRVLTLFSTWWLNAADVVEACAVGCS